MEMMEMTEKTAGGVQGVNEELLSPTVLREDLVVCAW